MKEIVVFEFQISRLLFLQITRETIAITRNKGRNSKSLENGSSSEDVGMEVLIEVVEMVVVEGISIAMIANVDE